MWKILPKYLYNCGFLIQFFKFEVLEVGVARRLCLGLMVHWSSLQCEIQAGALQRR